MVDVNFWGVRGSTPCPSHSNQRYGGNTACVTLERPGRRPIILDLGTGLRFFGESQSGVTPFDGVAFVTHIHWDHVQGLPFFSPVLSPGARLEVYGPRPESDVSLADAFNSFLRPPYFPVTVEALPGDIGFHDFDRLHGPIEVDGAIVTAGDVPHTGSTNGYRVDVDGVSIVYISDHQQPSDGSLDVANSVLELCHGADLVIHDAQYEREEFAVKSDWGHCTVEYAVNVAAKAGASRLALFHHDPARDDDSLDLSLATGRELGAAAGLVEVLAAAEGTTIALQPQRSTV